MGELAVQGVEFTPSRPYPMLVDDIGLPLVSPDATAYSKIASRAAEQL